MRFDYSPRASGKTTRMTEWLAADESRILITCSHDEENRLKWLYPKLKHRIVDWESYQHRHMHGNAMNEIAIDNADTILQSQLRQKIALVTMTAEIDSK